MKKIIDTSPRVMKDILKQPIDILNTNLRSEYRDYLRNGGWKCFLVHHPLELPVVMALILNKINDCEESLKIKIFIQNTSLGGNYILLNQCIFLFIIFYIIL